MNSNTADGNSEKFLRVLLAVYNKKREKYNEMIEISIILQVSYDN